jgi:PPOX class probable F420-dependent enzyme
MSIKEIKKFLTQGTFTAKIATVKKNGSPHVVPVWFVLDDEEHNDRKGKKIGDIILTTYEDSVKARNIDRDNRVSICIDDQTPQYSFVTISGTAKIFRYRQNELLKWATKIARRYMGRSKAKAYGERNSTEGAVLVRIRPTKVIAQKDTAEWE